MCCRRRTGRWPSRKTLQAFGPVCMCEWGVQGGCRSRSRIQDGVTRCRDSGGDLDGGDRAWRCASHACMLCQPCAWLAYQAKYRDPSQTRCPMRRCMSARGGPVRARVPLFDPPCMEISLEPRPVPAISFCLCALLTDATVQRNARDRAKSALGRGTMPRGKMRLGDERGCSWRCSRNTTGPKGSLPLDRSRGTQVRCQRRGKWAPPP